VFVEIGADARQFFAALNKVQKEVARVGQAMTSMGSRMAGIGAAIGAPIVLAARQFAGFDDAIRLTGAVSGATGADLQMLNDRARELGATTSFTAIQVATLMGELGRAGFKPDEINAMTGAVLDLARATGTDAALSAGIMAATLRQFGLGATDATRAADVLTAAANSTFNTVEGLGESLKYAGPVAKSLGMSLEDTAAILGVLGNVGIQGSEAGTALRRLSVISAGAGEELQKLFGVSNTDAAGNLKPLVDILDEINKVTAGMPVAERTRRMAEAFGLLGITSANVLSSSAEGVRGLADQLRAAGGTAARTAKEMDAGLGGSMRILLSAIEGTALAIGDALAPSLQQAAKFAEQTSTAITSFVKRHQELVVSVASGVAGFAAAGVAMLAMGHVVSMVASVFGTLLMASKAVVAPLFAIVATVSSMIMSFAAAVAGILAYSATSIAAAAASGAAWVAAHAPLAILLGVIAALGVAAFNLVGGFDGLSASLRQGVASAATDASAVLSDLGRVAKTTMQGVYDSIVAGDLEGAMAIALKGLLAAWIRGTSALQAKIDGFFAFIKNSADAAATFASNPLIAFDAIQSPEIVADRRALQRRQDERLNQVTADQLSRDAKAVQAENDLRNMTRDAGLTRTLRGQADGVIASVGNAGSMQQLTDLADEFFTLQDTGKLSVEQQQKYLDAVDAAIDRLNTRSAAYGSAETAPMTRADSDRRSFRSQADSALEQLASATSMEQVKELGDELSALAETGHLTEQQMQGLGGAVQAAQERVMRNAVEQAAAQSEVVGTFSADAVGGMGFGSSLQQKQLEELKGIRQEVKKLNDDGAVAA
jgi:TP901 family phage tail tape measure protein